MEKQKAQRLLNAAVAGIFAAGVAVVGSAPALAGGNGGGNDCNSCKGKGGGASVAKTVYFLADKPGGGNDCNSCKGNGSNGGSKAKHFGA